jgi:hypothetical protein
MEQVPLVAKRCVKEIGTFFNQHSHKDPQRYAPEDSYLTGHLVLCATFFPREMTRRKRGGRTNSSQQDHAVELQ